MIVYYLAKKENKITKLISDTSMNITVALHLNNTCISLHKCVSIVDSLYLNK